MFYFETFYANGNLIKEYFQVTNIKKEEKKSFLDSLVGETTEYDKKVALQVKKPKSWLKSVSAFANGKGGMLIFGIDDDDNVVGLEDAKKDSEIISEQIKVRMNPIPAFNLRIERVEGDCALVILDVYAGEQTPYYYDADGVLQAFIRIGNQSVLANPVQLKELILKGSLTSFDNLKSQYNFGDMSFTKLRAVYKQRTGLSFDDSDYESFGLIDEEGNLTNAGALLADECPIRYYRLFCTRWNGLDKAPGIIDATDDKEYSGGLINLLLAGIEFVENNSKKAWKKVGDGRVELPEYPQRAVLEGIVNALIHRNYLEIGSEVHIDMFDDRLEIYSPGGMYDGTKVQDRDIMRIPSRRRNPIIADVFHRLKYMDRRGSGFKKILSEYEMQDTYTTDMKPIFYSDNDTFLLVLKNLNYKKQKKIGSSEKQQDYVEHSKIAINMGIKELSDLMSFLEVPRTRKELQEFCNISSREYFRTKILNPLIEAKKIDLTIPDKPQSSKQKYVKHK